MKEIYNNVYQNNKRYNNSYDYKLEVVLLEIRKLAKSSKIIDIGCGKGHYIRKIISEGYSSTLGIEFSDVCCKEFLCDVPHVNADFLTTNSIFVDQQFDLCVCMDVLEHIEYKNIELMIENIKRIGRSSILGIANHSDVILGQELHLIQEDLLWWNNKLSQFYSSVVVLNELPNGRFFIFKCE
jgi:2-polyprenyl-3-methyl-5-hydroxy-6-metoxy-1,4-benzoquinol methylase